MKRRHPGQIVDHTAFRPGDGYTLIRASECDGGGLPTGERTFASCEEMTFVEALDNGELPAAMEALHRHPAEEDCEIRFTTHDIHGEIVVAAWGWNDALYDKWAWADLDGNHIDRHLIFVPSGDWAVDPRVHVVDWVNPDDICPVGLTWAEEEAMLRRRRDVAMRKALFD